MAIKIYKRNTAARRNMSIVKPEGVTDKAPEKRLTIAIKSRAGRALGKIAVRHRGGGHKRRYRLVDFRQDKYGMTGRIDALERDPNRSSLIALVTYPDGEKRYILATEGMAVGSTVQSGPEAPVAKGNRLQLKNIPSSTVVCNIEMKIGKGGQIVRSAGAGAVIMATEKGYTQIKMPSGEIRLVNAECYATIGAVSNFEHANERLGKAGRSRWKGRRPTVRGSAMNPVDHPHGGGEGRQPIGLKGPKTPWGKPALGKKTRRKRRYSNALIIKRRTKKK